MIEFVTLGEAKDHLRVTDHNEDDGEITLLLRSASGVIQNYLRGTKTVYEQEQDFYGNWLYDSNDDPIYLYDSSGLRIIRYEVKAATLLMIGIFYRDREMVDMEKWQSGFLPAPIVSLLYPLRDPAMR